MSSEDVLDIQPADTIVAQDDAPAPSKKSLKKAAKMERMAAVKIERRAREKEVKKVKKRARAEQIANGELVEDEEETKRQKKRKLHFGGRVIVDLGFDELMLDKEVQSLCSQLAYTYSANRQASFPFELLFSSLNGRTMTRLESTGDAAYKRWANTEWWEDGYENVWAGVANADSSTKVKNSLVYLTADTTDELLELRPNETYIIGGIVDHNRHKNLCLKKAQEAGIRTARLPIGRYLANMPTRKVLTVNQVFEIMLKWVETRNWEQALYAVMPKRKFQDGAKNSGQTVVSEADLLEEADVSREEPTKEPVEDHAKALEPVDDHAEEGSMAEPKQAPVPQS